MVEQLKPEQALGKGREQPALSKFTFTLDAEAEAFFQQIAQEMIQLFGIEETEAIGRINRHFHGQTIAGPNQMLYHQEEHYWAKQIYYEHNSFWWSAEWLAEHELRPKPYP